MDIDLIIEELQDGTEKERLIFDEINKLTKKLLDIDDLLSQARNTNYDRCMGLLEDMQHKIWFDETKD